MFTGIVEELGTVSELEVGEGHARLAIACREVVTDAKVGDSIAVNGCCLTVTDFLADGGFAADLMAETLRATSLGRLEVGDGVNLERAMHAQSRFGGHLVQGHVDGVGRIVELDEQPGTLWVTVAAPDELVPYLVPKGSVTIQGVSLTVVDVEGPRFRVGLIPHTREVTTLGTLRVGDDVNLEADVIAKYVERLLNAGTATPYAPGGTQG